MNIWQVFLMVGAGAATVGGGAYVAGVFDTPPAERAPIAPLASLPEKAMPDAGTAQPASQAEVAGGKTSRIVPPTFDIVRVEPSGDIVIAGSAAPSSAVEIVTGSQVIATATADASGNFASVLDDPLKPGDYQIVLRSTSPDGVTATSTETAVVSIPETRDGQVLALVEQPGEPSRLITKPEAKPAPADPQPSQSAVEPVSENPLTPATDIAAEEPAAANAETATLPPKSAEPTGTDAAAAEQAEPDPAKPSGTVEKKPEESAVAMVAPNVEEKAAVAQSEPDRAAAPAAEPAPNVTVEAVEIDGATVFVAGNGRPGHSVRLYANDILLGQTKVSEVGRFLLEATRDLPVGDYIIRADMLDKKASQVISRAAVPFEREARETQAAVAVPVPSESLAPAQPGQAAPEPEASKSEPEKVAATSQPENGSEVAIASTPAGTQLPPLNTEIASTPPEIIGTKLQNVNSSVIIRRGDNLWRISRRVYGRGVRYTTIYLANQEQIQDPHRIWPGQVFAVPDQTPEGDVADRSLMDERMAEEKEAAGQTVN